MPRGEYFEEKNAQTTVLPGEYFKERMQSLWTSASWGLKRNTQVTNEPHLVDKQDYIEYKTAHLIKKKEYTGYKTQQDGG